MPGLGSLTTEEVGEGPPSLLIVPLGATEQHGPHLPLGTDTLIASAWGQGVAAGLGANGQRATVAPALPFGSSGEHQSFAGTLSIGQDALFSVVVELCRSAAHSFRGVVLLSGHAGNLDPLTRAVASLRAEGHLVTHLVPTWGPTAKTGEPLPGDAHAGRTETSLMLHLDPGRVRSDRAEAGNTAALGDIMTAMRAGGVAAVAANGVLGDPTGASASEGRLLLSDLVDRTVDTLLDWMR